MEKTYAQEKSDVNIWFHHRLEHLERHNASSEMIHQAYAEKARRIMEIDTKYDNLKK